MDLRVYYRKIQEAMERIAGDYTVIVSHETADGGAAGVMTEVSREQAARAIVEERGRQATEEERQEFSDRQMEALREHEEQAARERVQVTLVTGRAAQKPRQRKKPEA